MSSQNTIQDELKSLGSSLPVAESPVFSVPDGYFDGLAAAVLAKVKSSETSTQQAELQELSPLLAGIPKTMPYSVPSFYFSDNLEVVSGIKGKPQSAILAAAGKRMPYQVQGNYFDALPAQMLAKVAVPQGKVVPLFARTWLRVAAAAAVAGALVFGGLQIFGSKPESVTVAQEPVSPAQVYTAQNVPAIEKDIKQVSTKEIEDFIETVQTTPEKEAKSENLAFDKKQVQELLKDVPTNEMENFLSALPSSDEELLATNEP